MKVGIIRSLSLVAMIALALVPAFATLAALVFLLAGTAVIILSLNRSLTAISSTAVTLIPVYCIASVLWSDYPAVSARLGIFLALTIAIAISIGSHLSIQTIARFTFWSHFVPVVLSFERLSKYIYEGARIWIDVGINCGFDRRPICWDLGQRFHYIRCLHHLYGFKEI